MAITNTAKPSTTLTNTTKVSFAELWSSITTTWATETRTWADCASLIDNSNKKLFGDFQMSEIADLTLAQVAGYTFQSNFSNIRNISKPS